jgi:40S ribosome biogenesis protein Tsr1 and BMS1 C-terminal
LLIFVLNKVYFQYERYFQPDGITVATFYAPIMFPPATCLVFKPKTDGTEVIVILILYDSKFQLRFTLAGADCNRLSALRGPRQSHLEENCAQWTSVQSEQKVCCCQVHVLQQRGHQLVQASGVKNEIWT